MLKQRVLTAVLCIPVLLWVLLFSPTQVQFSFLLVCVGLSASEISLMMGPKLYSVIAAQKFDSKWRLFSSILLTILLFWCSVYAPPHWRVGLIAMTLIGYFVLAVIGSHSNERAVANLLHYLIVGSYGAFPWVIIWELMMMAPGSKYAIFLMTVVWMGDTGAYFGGMALGRRKLAPTISPNKTVEGAVSGLVCSLLGGLGVNWAYNGGIAAVWAVVLAALLGGVAGQFGDLVESLFKRVSGVKDSGKLLPGHGGFLDRVDGLLFAAPAIWFILRIAGLS